MAQLEYNILSGKNEMPDVDPAKSKSNPIFSVVKSDLKKTEAELQRPGFIKLLRMTLGIEIRKFPACGKLLSDE